MKDIEILPNEAGVPTVTLYGDAEAAAQSKGITHVHVSLSHSEVCQTVSRTSIHPLTSLSDCRHRICTIRTVTFPS